jgi:hypothetical protein
VSGASCLPADTRPPPATLMLSVTGGDQAPVLTIDGWSVTVERLVVGVGNAALEDSCIQYSTGRYDRLLDARLPDEQKLSVHFGLGHCDLRYRLSGPSGDTLLGLGVSDADKVAMGTPATDAYATTPERVSLDFAATAERGAETARIHWLFRQVVRYRSCGLVTEPAEHADPQPIELASGASLAFHLVFSGEELLRDDAEGGDLRFDAIAAADTRYGDGDGEITLDELSRVSLDVARDSGPYRFSKEVMASPSATASAVSAVRSLGDYVSWVLLPRVAHFREAVRCTPFPAGIRGDDP